MKSFFNWIAKKKEAYSQTMLEHRDGLDAEKTIASRKFDAEAAGTPTQDMFRERVLHAIANNFPQTLKYNIDQQGVENSRKFVAGLRSSTGNYDSGFTFTSAIDYALYVFTTAHSAYKPSAKKVIDLLIEISPRKELEEALSTTATLGQAAISRKINERLQRTVPQPAPAV